MSKIFYCWVEIGSYFSQPSRPPPEDTDCFSQVQSHTCGHLSAPVLTCPGPAGGCNAGCQEGPPLCLPLCGPESGWHGMEPSLYFLRKTVLRCSSQSSSEALGCSGHQQPQQRPLEDTFLHLHSLFLCLVSPCATRPPEKQTPLSQASVPGSAVWNNRGVQHHLVYIFLQEEIFHFLFKAKTDAALIENH